MYLITTLLPSQTDQPLINRILPKELILRSAAIFITSLFLRKYAYIRTVQTKFFISLEHNFKKAVLWHKIAYTEESSKLVRFLRLLNTLDVNV